MSSTETEMLGAGEAYMTSDGRIVHRPRLTEFERQSLLNQSAILCALFQREPVPEIKAELLYQYEATGALLKKHDRGGWSHPVELSEAMLQERVG